MKQSHKAMVTNVSVGLVAEGDYLVESKPVDPPTKVVSLAMNRGLLVQMLRGAVDSKIDFNPKIFHQKFQLFEMNGGLGRD